MKVGYNLSSISLLRDRGKIDCCALCVTVGRPFFDFEKLKPEIEPLEVLQFYSFTHLHIPTYTNTTYTYYLKTGHRVTDDVM